MNNEQPTMNKNMQNKPNFQNYKMNVTKVLTKDYKNKSPRRLRKNKPNSNPIKPNLLDAQMTVTLYITKDYENKSPRRLRKNKANSNPKQSLFQTFCWGCRTEKIMSCNRLPH